MTKQAKVNLFYRQKVLLALIQACGGKLANVDLQKLLFLYTRVCQSERSYEFVPFKYGCFSFQSYADRRKLVELGALEDGDQWSLVPDAPNYLSAIKSGEAKKISLFAEKFAAMRGEELVKYVYRQFPYFAINSEIASSLLNEEELLKLESKRPTDIQPCLFTIGYEGGSFESYLNKLIENNVQILCDVRKNPISRKYGFSKKTLSETLQKLGIAYRHMPELGIESEKRRSLNSPKDYELLFDDYEKTVLIAKPDALDSLLKVVENKKRVAITCFEATQCMCHRGRIATVIQRDPRWRYSVEHL